jgi:hypothetical protein
MAQAAESALTPGGRRLEIPSLDTSVGSEVHVVRPLAGCFRCMLELLCAAVSCPSKPSYTSLLNLLYLVSPHLTPVRSKSLDFA